MKRPEKIWVGSLLYRVVYSNDAINSIAAPQNKHLLGNVNSGSLIITIDDRVTEQIIRDTLFHEVIHYIWREAGIDIHTDRNEEQLIDILITRIVSLYGVNPESLNHRTKFLKSSIH